jgi:hypothetical protein
MKTSKDPFWTTLQMMPLGKFRKVHLLKTPGSVHRASVSDHLTK